MAISFYKQLLLGQDMKRLANTKRMTNERKIYGETRYSEHWTKPVAFIYTNQQGNLVASKGVREV